MKTIELLSLCVLVAAISAQLYDRGGIGGLGGIDGFGGIGGIGGIDGIGGIGGPSGVGGGLLSQYCPTSFCFNGPCSRSVRQASYLGRSCFCSCGRY